MAEAYNLQKILMVDNHAPFIKAFAQQLLNRFPCQILVVDSLAKMHETLLTEDFSVVLCSLNLPDAYNGETLAQLSSLDVSVLVMTESYMEEVDNHIGTLALAEYLVQDSAAAIEHSVDVTVRLLKNIERPIWILSMSHYSESKLQSLLQAQRFPVRVFEHLNHLGEELGLSGKRDRLIEPVLPKLILITGASLNNCHGLIEWLDVLRQNYPSPYLPIMSCGRPTDLRVTMKLLKYGVNDFYNLHFTPEELYIRIDHNLAKI